MMGRLLSISNAIHFVLAVIITPCISAADGAAPEIAIQAAPGTGFTYQGVVTSNGAPINGLCDFEFALFDDALFGSQLGLTQAFFNLPVANGMFSVVLNPNGEFGPLAVNGEARWLQIAVRFPAGDGFPILLDPRQPLTPAPMAFALPNFYTRPHPTSPNIIGGHASNVVLDDVHGATIGGGGQFNDVNRVVDNTGTVGGGRGNTAGSDDGTTVSSQSATVGGGTNNTASGAGSTVGGGSTNTASGNNATVAGGSGNTASGSQAFVGGGTSNNAEGQRSAIAGGDDNSSTNIFNFIGGGSGNMTTGTHGVIGGGSTNATSNGNSFVGGGSNNTASGSRAVVAGGSGNTASDNRSFVGGGQNNQSTAAHSAVSGGDSNIASNIFATIAGGSSNDAEGFGSTVGGGQTNIASAEYSTIPGGFGAKADRYGEMAYANGVFSAEGDAQASQFVMRLITFNASLLELLLDNVEERLTVPVGGTMAFDVLVVARSNIGASAAYHFRGVLENAGGTVEFIGTPTKTILGEDALASSWDANIFADNAVDALVVGVNGAAGTTVRWVASVRTVEVRF